MYFIVVFILLVCRVTRTLSHSQQRASIERSELKYSLNIPSDRSTNGQVNVETWQEYEKTVRINIKHSLRMGRVTWAQV